MDGDRKPATPVTRLIIALCGVALLLGFVAVGANTHPFPESEPRAAQRTATAPPPEGELRDVESKERIGNPDPYPDPFVLPRWALWAMCIVLGGWLVLVLSRQRISLNFRNKVAEGAQEEVAPEEEVQAADVVRVTHDLIDDLRAITDPRLAVMHAYASVEAGFGIRTMKRKPAETPQKYMDRIFGQRAQAKEPLSRLTHLFEVARFSQRPMDETMRQDAIDALATIRDSYRGSGLSRLTQR